MFLAASNAYDWESDGKLLRLLRMLRLLKLVRVVKASRLLGRWVDHVSISFAMVSLLKFVFVTVVLAHWGACYWGFLGDTLEADLDAPWTGYGSGQSWRQKAGVSHEATPAEVYGISLYVALNNIFGGRCATPLSAPGRACYPSQWAPGWVLITTVGAHWM